MDDPRLQRIGDIEVALALIDDHVQEAKHSLRPFPIPVPTGGFEASEERLRLIHRHLTRLLRELGKTYGVGTAEHELVPSRVER